MGNFHRAVNYSLSALAGLGLSHSTAATGEYVPTGSQSDLAIVGEGYFVIRAGSELLLTRHLRFQIDSLARFRTLSGNYLIGYPAAGGGPEVLRFGAADSPQDPAALVTSFQIRTNGELAITYSNGETLPGCQIPLWVPPHPGALKPVGEAEFTHPALAGDWAEQLREAGTDGAGWIQAGSYELPTPVMQVTRFDRTHPTLTAGPLVRTGIQTHLALDGPGFFRVYDPVTGSSYLTRCGAMKLDANGYLVTVEHSFRVQGCTDSVVSWDAFEPMTKGDVQINVGTPPAGLSPPPDPEASLVSYAIDGMGVIQVCLSDGTAYIRGKLQLVDVADVDELIPAGSHLYASPGGTANGPSAEHDRDPDCRVVSGALDFNQIDETVLEIWKKQLIGLQCELLKVADPDLLAISGRGFFVLRHPDSGRECFTRLGVFHWSQDGYLESTGGWRVQGFHEGERVAGDIQLNSQPDNPIIGRQVDSEGRVWVRLANGEMQSPAGIGLMFHYDVTELQELYPYHYQYSPELIDASRQLGFLQAPGTYGLGRIQHGAIESLWDMGRYLPAAAPQRGVMLSTWGLAGRRAFLVSTDDLNQWPATGFPMEWGQEIPPTGSLAIAADPGAPHRFFRLVVGYEYGQRIAPDPTPFTP